jgi:hypothetical protein
MKMMTTCNLIEAFARHINENNNLTEANQTTSVDFNEHVPEIVEEIQKRFKVSWKEGKLFLDDEKYINLASAIYVEVNSPEGPSLSDWNIKLRGSLGDFLQAETRFSLIQSKLNNAAELINQLEEDINDIQDIIEDKMMSIEDEESGLDDE